MAPDPALLSWFVDESLMGVGKALSWARKDTIHAGHVPIPGAPTGALDVEWMPVVAAAGLVVIGRDKKIRTKPAEVATLRSYGLRVFYLTGPKDMTTWDYMTVLVKKWDDMERTVQTRGPGPWFMAVTATGVRQLRV
jgi:hypothetical protein